MIKIPLSLFKISLHSFSFDEVIHGDHPR